AALLLRKAEVLRKLGRSGEALEILEQLRARGEGGLAGLRLLGELRIQEKEDALRKAREEGAGEEILEKAREDLEETRLQVARDLVQANPTDLGLKFRLGEALLARGLLDEAVAEFQQAVKDPRYKTEAQVRLARAFRQKGLVDLALSQYSKALESLGPSGEKTREVLYEMGVLLEEKGDLQGAKEKFARIYEEDITFKDVSERLERLSKA
ncbi:MAG TPA: tetratricopeptide repeat protein, partial [Planctomycetes bacterium]|nr:tetratricopeptide repeat protein [Planctomycetota bacterium]